MKIKSNIVFILFILVTLLLQSCCKETDYCVNKPLRSDDFITMKIELGSSVPDSILFFVKRTTKGSLSSVIDTVVPRVRNVNGQDVYEIYPIAQEESNKTYADDYVDAHLYEYIICDNKTNKKDTIQNISYTWENKTEECKIQSCNNKTKTKNINAMKFTSINLKFNGVMVYKENLPLLIKR